MRLIFHGHACFEVQRDDGLVVLLDPYRSGALGGRIAYAPPDVEPDVVVISHFHEDHGWFGSLAGQFEVVDRPTTVRGIAFGCVWLPHDGCCGTRAGLTRAFGFEVDGIGIVHPGDLGRLPTDEEIAALGRCDLLLLPVGGTYTISPDEAAILMRRLAPRWTVPMHYRCDAVDLPMATRDVFVDALPASVPRHCVSTLTAGTPPGVVLMEPRSPLIESELRSPSA